MNELERLRSGLAGRYRVDRELGRGGMATVYLAHDLKHDRPVAIKVLRPELVSRVGVERFLREIQIEARLQHVNILPLYDSGDADGLVYYVMRYVEGESLRERIAREQCLSIGDALRITREIADALDYAHGHGVVHRDVKPENILLSDGHAVLADFGIGRAIDAAAGTRLTESGHSVGTPAYMSPEQASGEADLDGRSDIYSLACVLFEMLVGEPPFGGRTVRSIIAKQMMEPPPSLDTLRPEVPSRIKIAMQTALAKTPADRFQTIDEFMTAIDGSVGGEGVAGPATPRVREESRSEYGGFPSARDSSFFGEARRRYLPQVGAIYLVFAWFAGDWAVDLADSGAVAPWLLPVALALLVAGLPLVLAVVWIQRPVSGAQSRLDWRRWVGTIRAGHVMSLLAVIAFGILLARQTPVPPNGDSIAPPRTEYPATRIAVLTFDDPSPGREFAHLAIVIPEYLTRQLSQLEAFDVVPHAAVRGYAPESALDSVARAVRAGTLIEGTVIGSASEIRVTVNLTDANDLALLHSAESRKPPGEWLALLDEVTDEVARSLRRELGVVIRDLERIAGTNSDEAWEHYARGREWATLADTMWQAGGSERALQTYSRADTAFARAQSIDPDWVDPIVERGWVRYHQSEILSQKLRTRDPELLRQGTELASDALERDSVNGRALDLRGTLRYWLAEESRDAEEAERLRKDAERDLRAATAIDSTNAHAWHRLWSVYTALGNHEDAKAAAARALDADQYYEEREAIFAKLCAASVNTRQWAEVTRWCDAGLSEFPRSRGILNAELLALASPGGPEPDVERAWQLRDAFLEANPPQTRPALKPSATFYVAAVLARAGLSDSARTVIRQGRDAADEPDPWNDYNEAHVRLLLGETEVALDLLGHYLEAMPGRKQAIAEDWWFESLRPHPRFQDLVKR